MTSTMLIIHVISGFLALVCGAVAISTKKGKGVHVTAGRVYFWSMMLVACHSLLSLHCECNPLSFFNRHLQFLPDLERI